MSILGVSKALLRRFNVMRAWPLVAVFLAGSATSALANTPEVKLKPSPSIPERVAAVREKLQLNEPQFKAADQSHIGGSAHNVEVAQQWLNWANWNNWRNWANWANWRNF